MAAGKEKIKSPAPKQTIPVPSVPVVVEVSGPSSEEPVAHHGEGVQKAEANVVSMASLWSMHREVEGLSAEIGKALVASGERGVRSRQEAIFGRHGRVLDGIKARMKVCLRPHGLGL